MSTPPPLIDGPGGAYLGPLDVAKSLVMGQRWIHESKHPSGYWMVRFSEHRFDNVIPHRLASESGNSPSRAMAWRRALGHFFEVTYTDEEHLRIGLRQERLLMTLGFGRV